MFLFLFTVSESSVWVILTLQLMLFFRIIDHYDVLFKFSSD